MKDMLGTDLEVGDYIVDSRGRAYQILPTEPTIQAAHVVLCRMLSRGMEPTTVRLVGVQRISHMETLLNQSALLGLFNHRVSETADSRREALRQRRREVHERLRAQGLRHY